MKIELYVIPNQQNDFAWQHIFDRLNSYTFIQKSRKNDYVLTLMNSDQRINNDQRTNLFKLYSVVSPDDSINDFYIHFFYDNGLSSSNDNAYDFLKYYDEDLHIISLKSMATRWHKLQYWISFTIEVDCSLQAVKWYFGYILAIAEVYEGLIMIDEDADKVGKATDYGKSFDNIIRFGLYTPIEFKERINVLNQ